jgi:hypothetical protein
MTNARTKQLLAGSTLIAVLAVGATTYAQGFRPGSVPAGSRLETGSSACKAAIPEGSVAAPDAAWRLRLQAARALPRQRQSGDRQRGVEPAHRSRRRGHRAVGPPVGLRQHAARAVHERPKPDGWRVASYLPRPGAAAGDLRAGRACVCSARTARWPASVCRATCSSPRATRTSTRARGEVHGMPALVLSGEGDSLAYAVNAGVDVQEEEQRLQPRSRQPASGRS